jgi:hypothetical protein
MLTYDYKCSTLGDENERWEGPCKARFGSISGACRKQSLTLCHSGDPQREGKTKFQERLSDSELRRSEESMRCSEVNLRLTGGCTNIQGRHREG